MIQLVSRHACEFVSCRAQSLTSKIAARKNSDGSVISALAYSCFEKQERGTYHTWQITRAVVKQNIFERFSIEKYLFDSLFCNQNFLKTVTCPITSHRSPLRTALGPSDWVRRHFWDLKKLSPNLLLGCLQASGTASERHCTVPVMLWQEPETSYTILQPRRD